MYVIQADKSFATVSLRMTTFHQGSGSSAFIEMLSYNKTPSKGHIVQGKLPKFTVPLDQFGLPLNTQKINGPFFQLLFANVTPSSRVTVGQPIKFSWNSSEKGVRATFEGQVTAIDKGVNTFDAHWHIRFWFPESHGNSDSIDETTTYSLATCNLVQSSVTWTEHEGPSFSYHIVKTK
jgi:hypothetical protein